MYQQKLKIVPRPRLTKKLNAGLTSKLTLIAAPAGFGKSTLLSEWIAEFLPQEEPLQEETSTPIEVGRERVSWLTLDNDDRDPIRFLTYLIAALQKFEITIGEMALGLLQSPQPPPLKTILTINGCFSRAVFEIIPDPQKVLAEMIRVVRPGGRIVVSAPDSGAWAIDASDKVLTRRIIDFISDHQTNGWIGRQLPNLFHELGLHDNIVVPNTSITNDYALMRRLWLEPYLEAAQAAGAVSASEAAMWRNDLEHRSQMGRFFSAITTFVVCGTKL